MTTILTPKKILEKAWEGLPGYILRFPLTIAMTGKVAADREVTVGLSTLEKAERLLDFRMRTLADILYAAPSMLSIQKLSEALEAKHAAAIAERIDLPEGEDRDKAEKELRQTIRLTDEEAEALAEPFPDFPDVTPETLSTKAYEYFNREEDGRKVFQLLVEDVIEEFWYWATPRPTISVSVFTQGK